MIRGIITPWGGPGVTGLLSFPRLQYAAAEVTFLLDTGAMFSVIHPKDIKALGLDVMTAFESTTRSEGRGVGGRANYFVDEARLTFEHEDGLTFDYRLDVRIAVPTDDNADYPSFLGMDFISEFILTVDFAERFVILDDSRLRASIASR